MKSFFFEIYNVNNIFIEIIHYLFTSKLVYNNT